MEPDSSIRQAVETLRMGGVVAYPTETVYGLGAMLEREPVKRMLALKRRETIKPVSIAVCSLSMMERYATLHPNALELIGELAPGPYTFVLAAKDTVPSELLGGGSSVGIRFPSSHVALRLIEQVGGAITSTSANLSGMPPPTHWSDVELEVDFLLKGECELKEHSTVIDAGELKILRRGAGADEAELLLSTVSP